MPRPKPFSRDSVNLGSPKREWLDLEVGEILTRLEQGQSVQLQRLGLVRAARDAGPGVIELSCGDNGWRSWKASDRLAAFVLV